jgi:hypothetical protein
MSPVMPPINTTGIEAANASHAIRTRRRALLVTKKIPQQPSATMPVNRPVSSHPHHGRSDGLKGMAGIVASVRHSF